MFMYLKTCYKQKIFNNDSLKAFVVHGDITPEQYEQITGVPYSK
ncbi:XkdX family protein [uncultured Duncaniella sp.]|nr:XkdX family protein [uncultured Duncaniella sp.]